MFEWYHAINWSKRMPTNEASHEITKTAQSGVPMTLANYEQAAMRTMADQDMIRERNYKGLDKHGCLHIVTSKQMTQMDNAARGMAGDAGEVNTCIQAMLEYGKPLDLTNLLEELGDVQWRIVQMLDAVGFTLEDVMRANIRKLAIRFPGKYTDFLAAEENRNRERERQAVETLAPLAEKVPFEPAVVQTAADTLLARNTDIPQIGDPYPTPRNSAGEAIPVPSPGIPKITPLDDLRLVAPKYCAKCGLKLYRNNPSEFCNSCVKV